MRHHRIIDFKQQLHAIPFILQLLLGSESTRRVQYVIHGHRDLLRDLLHEGDLFLLIGPLLEASKSHRPETALRRCERNHTKGLDAVLAQHGHQFWETGFGRHILNQTGDLVFPGQSPGRFVDGQFKTGADCGGLRGHQEPQTHDIARGLVQDHVHVIERDDLGESLSEILKQLVHVAV